MVPWSMRIGWLLARAHRRTLGGSLARWQAAAAPPTGPGRCEDHPGGEARRSPTPGRAPHPGHGAPPPAARPLGPPAHAARLDEASPSGAGRGDSRIQGSPAGLPQGEVARRAAHLNRAAVSGAPPPARMRE
ncbi:unnamed protein product [Prorocentrum cordatum]|nr:unnamed protein product [Polarella glacialis]